MARKARVSYQMVTHSLGMDPSSYLRELREETGLAWWKLGKDLEKDAGVGITAQSARKWGTK